MGLESCPNFVSAQLGNRDVVPTYSFDGLNGLTIGLRLVYHSKHEKFLASWSWSFEKTEKQFQSFERRNLIIMSLSQPYFKIILRFCLACLQITRTNWFLEPFFKFQKTRTGLTIDPRLSKIRHSFIFYLRTNTVSSTAPKLIL